MDVKSMFHSVTDKIMDTVHQFQGKGEKISVANLAEFIKADVNTIKTTTKLLGIDLHEYRLQDDDLRFILETKGNITEKILSLTVLKEGNPLVKYRSYDLQSSTEMTFSIPKSVLH